MPETTAGRILGNKILNTKGDKIRHKGNKLVQILAFEINRATMITNISWCILGSGAWTLSPLRRSPSTTGWRDISAALASSGLREGWTPHQPESLYHIHDQSYLVCFNDIRVESTSLMWLWQLILKTQNYQCFCSFWCWWWGMRWRQHDSSF